MIRDFDSKINKLTDSVNYMDQLQQITGNLFSIDKEYFEDMLKKVDVMEKLIVPSLIQYFEDPETEIIKRYQKISSEFNVVESSIMLVEKKRGRKSKKPSKTVEIVNHDCIGEKLLKTEWFCVLKELEQKSNDLLEAFDSSDYSKVKAVYDSDKTLLTIKTFYGVPITSSQKLSALKNINKITNQIIDLYTHPLYDVNKKIHNNWTKLGNIFKDIGETDEIIKMLEQFMICKYRCEITGNNKYYMKLFQSIFQGENAVAQIDGSKFLRIVDSVDMSQLSDNANLSKFADSIKTIIKSMSTGEKTLEESLECVKGIFGDDDIKEISEERAKIDSMDDPLGFAVNPVVKDSFAKKVVEAVTGTVVKSAEEEHVQDS